MRIGIISDTHMPQRCRDLPAAVHQVFADTAFILHAGDVGELWVLDQLARIAPVIAVHGNDDSVDAQRELPEQQIISVAPHRIHLWHSHHPDRAQELAARQGDDLAPKLTQIADRARRSRASLAIFGHWHIPLVWQTQGLTLINPGAIASGNEMTEQLIQTVAILEVAPSGAASVSHYDLADPAATFDPAFAPSRGFQYAAQRFSAPILSPKLEGIYANLRDQLASSDRAELVALMLRLSHQVWDGERDQIDVDDFRTVLEESGEISPALYQSIAAGLRSAR